MPVAESVGIALFLMVVVCFVLFGIYLCIKFFSLVVKKIAGGQKGK